MKKVVLLTGVLAAGLAVAPVTVKAEVASVPQAPEVTEDKADATELLNGLLEGLNYDVAAIKKQVTEKTDAFVGMEDEAQAEALADILEIEHKLDLERQKFEKLQYDVTPHLFIPATLTEAEYVEKVNEIVLNIFLTRDQAQKYLVERYVHLDKDWKLFRGFQQKGDELWNKVMDVVNGTQYKGVDEIKDVFDKHEALNTAAKAYRTAYLANHENRTKTWNSSNDCHTDGKQCLVEAEGSVNDLYAKYLKAYEELDALVKKYYTDQTSLQAKVDNVDPSTYTKSVDGIDTVEKAQKAANDFINTFNAGSVADWEDYLTGEDTKAPAFKEEAEYVKRAEALIKALNDAVAEAKANEAAYQKGLTAIAGSQKDLDAIKDEYYNTPKENVAGYVYRALIDGLQTKINNEKNGLVDAWNNWDFTVATDPVNAVEYVADKDFNKVKGEIADALKTIQENEAANKANHELADAIDQHIQEMGLAVISWNHVHMDEYAADGVCEDGRNYWGTVTLLAEQAAFTDAEQKAYDEIKAKKYLDETAQDVKTNIDNNIELLWNHIATDQCEKSLEIVNKYYDDAHEANEALDPVCDEMGEFGLTPHCRCLPEDTKDNPCGWCDPTAKAEHDAIEAGYRENVGLLDKKHAETLAKTLVNDFIMYEESAKAAVDQWTADFEKAHAAHMEKLLAALHTSMDQVHALEHTAETAEHHLNSFTTGDRAAADAWVVEKGYAGVTNFAEYVNFLRENHELPGKVQTAFDEHHYNELVKLGADAYALVLAADYTKAVEANKAAVDKVYAELKAIEASVPTIDANLVYDNDFNTLSDKVDAILEAIATEQAAAQKAYDEGKAAEFGFTTNFGELLNNLNADLAAAKKFYADNVKAAQELTSLFDGLKEEVTTAPVGDVYASDAEILQGKRTELLGRIAVEAGYVAADLADGKVLENYETTKGAYETLLDDVKGFEGQIKDAEKYLADSKAKAAELTADVNDLVVLLRSALPGDVYENIESDKDLEALYDLYEALSDDLLAENAAIATDLANRAILDNAAAHEAAISALSIRVSEYQGKVKEYEQFKADNKATRDALINDLTNLLVTVDGLKKYGDVYEEGAEGFDANGIDRAIENLENSINGDLSFLKNIDYPAGEVLENVLQYKDGIETYKQDIEDIKEQIATAEQLYAANYRALNNLEEMIMAEKTVLENTKAMCACNECNGEDMEAVQDLLGQLDTILGDVNDSFSETKDLAMQEGAFKAQVDEVKADVANLLALIQLHLDTAQNDLRVYNTLQALLANTVDAEMLKLEAEEGYKCFASREAYHNEDYNPERPHFHDGATTNPNVKYGNELAQMVEDLKAEIDRQHSHEGGHTCEENKLADVKAMNDIVAEIQKTIVAVKANEAAHKLLQDRFEELFEDAKDAYNFWHQYYSTATLITHEYDIAQWIKEWNGVLENGDELAALENLLHDYYVHGNAANAWTVDGKGEELNDAANNTFAEKDADLANDRNEFAHTEALNHLAQVVEFLDTYKNGIYATYTEDGFDDPFVKDILVVWRDAVEGEYGLYASLNLFRGDIQAAYEEGVMEDAINIDNHNTALGIHQQLDGVLGVLSQIEDEYAALYEYAHHLTNGKTLYSDMEYVTIGFFRHANEGLGDQAEEMFQKVKVNFDPEVGNIGIYDTNWLVVNDWDDVNNTPDNWFDDVAIVDRDFAGHLVHAEGLGVIPAEIGVLVNGEKENELTFTLNDDKGYEVVTLAAGPADITFQPGSLEVDGWTTKHNVYIEVNVAAPEVDETTPEVSAGSNKLVVRLNNPIDLTYTINSLVAKTDDGTEFSYADRVINYAKGTIEFNLPEGTKSVELPEGFFTFRTSENRIARSAALTVNVAVSTSISDIIAMGEQAQIFDLQGRRVKAESLISGNAYVVNGEKVMVK